MWFGTLFMLRNGHGARFWRYGDAAVQPRANLPPGLASAHFTGGGCSAFLGSAGQLLSASTDLGTTSPYRWRPDSCIPCLNCASRVCVKTGARVHNKFSHQAGQTQRLIQLPKGGQHRIRSDIGSVKFDFYRTVKIDPQCFLVFFNHWVLRPGICFLLLTCRFYMRIGKTGTGNSRFIWVLWV